MAANGDMLGQDQPVILHLLDIEPAKQALEGVKMELMDAAYPLLVGEACWELAAAPVLLWGSAALPAAAVSAADTCRETYQPLSSLVCVQLAANSACLL
jgi:hypothetical protein